MKLRGGGVIYKLQCTGTITSTSHSTAFDPAAHHHPPPPPPQLTEVHPYHPTLPVSPPSAPHKPNYSPPPSGEYHPRGTGRNALHPYPLPTIGTYRRLDSPSLCQFPLVQSRRVCSLR